jgi:hypothetical protein
MLIMCILALKTILSKCPPAYISIPKADVTVYVPYLPDFEYSIRPPHTLKIQELAEALYVNLSGQFNWMMKSTGKNPGKGKY